MMSNANWRGRAHWKTLSLTGVTLVVGEPTYAEGQE